MTPNPTQSEINAALRSVLIGMLPSGVDVILGQVNRVPEPETPDFVIFWPTARRRISTNTHETAEAVFTGSIAGDVLTAGAPSAPILVGASLSASTVAVGTTITAAISGTGGAGTYRVSPSQTVASTTIAAGAAEVTQATEITIQCDVHGPASNENAQTISTLMRDEYAFDAFAAINPNIAPLLADDPRQIPFFNAESQYETRWIVEALLQANQTIVIPQQYAATLALDVVSVEAMFPVT